MKKLSIGLALSFCLFAATTAFSDTQSTANSPQVEKPKAAHSGSCCKEGTATTAQAGKPKPYTRVDCIVTGEKLGSMGEPFVHKHDGQEVKFCCKGCLKSFNKQPAKYLAKLDETSKGAKSQAANK